MFTKVDALIWSDDKFKALSDDGKLIFLYLLTSGHRNVIGLYHLPIPYGSYDMNWEVKRFTKGLQELLDKGLVNYNFNTNIVLITNYLKYNPLENPNQVKGAIKALNSIPTNGLDKQLIDYLKGLDKPFIKPLVELLQERLAKHVYVDVDVNVDVNVDVKEDNSALVNEVIGLYKTKLTKLSQPRVITDQRKSHINARINDYGIEEVKRAIDIVSKSKFLLGEIKADWKADIDWIFLPTNFAKILEGKYNDKTNLASKSEIDEENPFRNRGVANGS